MGMDNIGAAQASHNANTDTDAENFCTTDDNFVLKYIFLILFES